MQMTDDLCKRCSERPVALLEIIQIGHGDRYHVIREAARSWNRSQEGFLGAESRQVGTAILHKMVLVILQWDKVALLRGLERPDPVSNRDVILAYEILPSIPKEHHNFHEVKDYAITCLGIVISTFGDHLRVELPSCLPVLVDYMGNERTRLTAVKAFAVIAASPLHLEISCVLEQVVSELSALLKKANQPLSDSDLHMTALALELCCTLMLGEMLSPSGRPTVRIMILPRAMTLVKSLLLQGQALQALQEFFAVLVRSANTSFDELLETLVSTAKTSPEAGGAAEKALFSIATCIAVICLAAGHEKCSSTVDMLANILKDDSNKCDIVFEKYLVYM
ncbi:Cullin-associated NEDD8-dissociated protein 1 [Orobanche hederae]